MSRVGQKRKRPSPNAPIVFRTAVQSVFSQAAHEELERRRRQQALPSKRQSQAVVPTASSTVQLRRSLLSTLCARLQCLSKTNGIAHLTALKKELKQLTYSSSDLISLLFTDEDDEDDVEMAPPLCVIVRLLRDDIICLADVPATFFIQRAVIEINQPSLCDCQPGRHQGIVQVVDHLLDGNRSSRCDAFLRQFFSVFFHFSDSNISQIDSVARFRLAKLVVECVHKECLKYGELVEIVTQWVQQAVTPSRFLDRPERDNTHVIWTPELSGLATNRNVDEYLACSDSERDALQCLFKVIPVESASKIYLQCVIDVLKTNDYEDQKKDPVIGTWSRLVLLGNRITDKTRHTDVDENIRRRIVSSITGTLCSSSCYNDPTSVAVILCLARRALMNEDELDSSEQEQALERYYAWFRDLVASCDVLVVKSLIEPLTQLLPLESVAILKLNHRVLSANRAHFRLASDYVALVRSRIRDFDPGFAGGMGAPSDNVVGNLVGDARARSRPSDKPSVKIMKEIVELVSCFVKSNQTLPKNLVFQMNFHRHHFHKATLPMLIDPDFVVLRPRDGDKIDLTMSPEVFDERRMDIITEIAFKRKDQAMSKAEGKAAIKAIKEANKKREEERKHGKIEQRPKLASENVRESSELKTVMEAIFKDESVHGFNATQVCENGIQVRKAKELLTTNIVNRVERCESKEENLASVSLDILQSICSAIEAVELENGQLFNLVLTENDGNILEKYTSWWGGTGRSLLWLFSLVLGDQRLLPLHVPMRCQLFALICCRIRAVSTHTIHALSMIIVVLIVLRENSSLCDLCFVLTQSESLQLRHFGFVVFENLSLCDYEHVSLSAMFMIECMFLLSGFSSSDLLEQVSDAGNLPTARQFGNGQYEVPIAKFIEPLVCMARWLVSNPWRMNMMSHHAKTGDFEDSQRMVNQRQVFLKAVHALSEFGSIISSDLLLNDVLSLELRCQWGKQGAIAKFLHSLRSSGTSAIEIVHRTSLFLAREASSDAKRNTDWVLSGLLTFHDQIRSPTVRIRNEECAAFQVEQCARRNGAGVAFRLMEYYRSLDYDYFHGCEDIDKHILQIFLSLFWPLPKRMISYAVRCLKRISSRRCQGLSSNVFFVGNSAIFHDNAVSLESVARKNGHKRTDLFRKIGDISLVLGHLTNVSHSNYANIGVLDGGEDFNGQTSTQSHVRSMVTRVGFDHAFTLGISIGMYLGTYSGIAESIDDDEKVVQLVRHITSTVIAKVEKVACCDVLDCAITACAMLPFGRVDENEDTIDSARNECVQRTNAALRALIDERVSLCNGDGRLNPFWARDIMATENGVFNLERKNSHDVAQVLSVWDGRTASRCISRILGVVGCICNTKLSQFVIGIGNEPILSVILPNLIWAYSICMGVSGSFGSLLRDDVVRAVKKLSDVVDNLVEGGALASLAGRFGDCGVEIVNLINSGAYG